MTDVKQKTLLDEFASWISPSWGLRRLKGRAMAAVAGGYLAGRVDRRSMSKWKTSTGSADADILPDLPTMRERSRDLVRNAPIAAGAVSGVVNSVVGTGLALQSNLDKDVLGLTEEAAAEAQKQIEREFRLWADTPDCDLARTLDFYGLQELAFRSTLESGDCFALLPMVQTMGSIYTLKVQLLEGDRVSQPKGEKETPTFAGGVKLDPSGAPASYYIRTSHPGDLGSTKEEWKPYEAFGKKTGRRNVLHLYRKLRPGQTRGVPYLAPVVEALKQLDRYTEAEIMAAVVSGMFSVFIKSESGITLQDMTTGAPPAAGQIEQNLKSGAIIDLAPGESIEVANPGRPNANFDPFIQSILVQVAMALEIPFEVLLKRFNSSFSASKAALLEAWRFFNGRRAWLVTSFCQPVFEAWMDEAVARGRVIAPGYFQDPAIRRAYLGTKWIGDSPGQIDPTKEVEAARQRIELGLSTHAEECAALTGGDWETKHFQLAREVRMRKEAGLIHDYFPEEFGDSSKAAQPGQPAPGQPKPKDETEDGTEEGTEEEGTDGTAR
jgi:lambda family phage portal protein